MPLTPLGPRSPTQGLALCRGGPPGSKEWCWGQACDNLRGAGPGPGASELGVGVVQEKRRATFSVISPTKMAVKM